MEAKKHNILWICTDSQRWDTLGCYGNPWVRTPNLDRLASRGILFENAFCQNPLCTPSRGNFLTGRYPVTNKLRQNGQDISPDEVLVTRVLHDNGYVCGLSGKLHICACDHRLKLFGKNDWWKHDAERMFRGTEPRVNDGYDEFYWDHAPGPNMRSSAYLRWLQERGQTLDYPKRDDSEHVLHGMPEAFTQTAFCVEKAMGFIEAYKGSHYPWLFSVNIFDPHFSLRPCDRLLERYLEKLDELPDVDFLEGELDNKPPCQKRWSRPPHPWGMHFDKISQHERKLIKAAYWAMVDHIDAEVGRLLDTLDKTGQAENTLVIFTTDHGEMLGDHGLYVKGPALYEGAVHVPLIVSMPGVIPEGIRTPALVELGDLAPTVLDYAGLPREPGMQARSLWPLLTGEAPADSFRDDVYCEYYNSNMDDPPQFLTMVRDHHAKIIVSHGKECGELYDLDADPKEFKNLWDDPAAADLKSRMLKKTCDAMARTIDPLPERIGIY
ncbi:MAG: sulfatase-like hydrolase/transferase [Kiritimatiellaeota bacterium]|nr:sulfatase-like hydrolase/transferase [Kiritimatiellota bacterium]